MNIDELFWNQIDPLYHLKQANCLRYAQEIKLDGLFAGSSSSEAEFDHDLLGDMQDMRASAIRFIRFHATETLFTVLLGSPPHGPIPRFSKKFFGQPFNAAVASISAEHIPDALRMSSVNEFEGWLSAKFYSPTQDNTALPGEINNFICHQASFFSQKMVYNAFKHGCRVGRSSQSLSVQDETTGEWQSLIDIKDGVGWLDWREDKKTQTATVTLGAMDCDLEDDYGAILVMACLVRALRKIHLSKEAGTVTIQLPTDIKAGMTTPTAITIRRTIATHSAIQNAPHREAM